MGVLGGSMGSYRDWGGVYGVLRGLIVFGRESMRAMGSYGVGGGLGVFCGVWGGSMGLYGVL